MIVMVSNNTGWHTHCLARETGKLGHLFSADGWKRPFPWLPYALDNGAFSCWDRNTNYFDADKWAETYPKWKQLIYKASTATQRPLWAIVPDTPGCAAGTIVKYKAHVQQVIDAEILPAIAVQDGMTPQMVKELYPSPGVIAIGGTDEFKWGTIETWVKEFKRVHVLRCNMPDRLQYLEDLGIESCDGTGWMKGNRMQLAGLENWARKKPEPKHYAIAPHAFRAERHGQQEWAF
jgi:hypothetical protein